MLGLLCILTVSWVLLYLIEAKNLNALGLIPNKARLVQFAVGFIFIMLVVLVNIGIETNVLQIEWHRNTDLNLSTILKASYYHLRSALTEDLVFRGALLYILIQRIGATYAIWLSALVFGVYHVFSYGMGFNRIIPILYVVCITGFTGYVWAYLFYKTKSIYLGLSLHVGINLMNTFFFASQPYGELVFMEVSREALTEGYNFLFLIAKGLFPSLVTLICAKSFFKRNLKIL
ncbi:lysostaphin resistance A-like protein [Winogradskyella poriferorum]|uniref:CPBP family intramembrane glutamic endopeptidase n=1 Tax=Winogradskyella poriferorum TaxID=307627 RepID=UPI003D6504A6